MTVGAPVTRQDVDETMMQLALTVRELLRRVEDTARWSSATTQETLQAAPYGYSTDDAYLIKATIDYLNAYRLQAGGGDPPATAHDLTADLARFTGLNLT